MRPGGQVAEHIHQLLDEEIRSIAGYYMVLEEGVLEYKGRNLLYLVQMLRGQRFKVPLIPCTDTVETSSFYTYTNGVRSSVNFTETPGGGMDLYTGSQRLHRTM